MSSLEEQLVKAQKTLEDAKARGSSSAESYEQQVQDLKKKIKLEDEKIKPHPALQFGPISQTVSIMSAISLGMSVAPLPYQAIPFYNLFSTLTIAAVLCLVCYTSIIWYGYNEALSKLPKPDPEAKLKKLMKPKPTRPDDWAHTRSHPSHFLTTRHAPPRLFPFPLGKSRPAASIKDELWWEGGNAPHVGHFNKPTAPAPPNPSESYLVNKMEKSMAMEKQRKIWKKRINGIKALSVIVIVAFINQKVAIAGLCYLIYTTLHTEMQNMLQPPEDLDRVYDTIDRLTQGNLPASGLKPDRKNGLLAGGMAYLYDPTSSGGLIPNSNIPLQGIGPPPVGMTTGNHYYAGPGEVIKKES